MLNKLKVPDRLFTYFLLMVLGTTLISSRLQAQTHSIDSLKSELLKAPVGSEEKADLLHQLAMASWSYDFDEALRWAQEANQFSKSISYKKGIVQSLTDIGQYYYYTAEYPVARQIYRQALQEAGKENFGNYPAYTLARLGNLYRVQSLFDSSQYYYQLAINLLANNEEVDHALSSVYLNWGILKSEQSEFNDASAMMRKALHIRLAMRDSVEIAECWSYIGHIKTRTFELDSADYYLKKSFHIAEKYNVPLLKFMYYMRSGEVSFRRTDYGKATELYTEAIEFVGTNDYRRYSPEILKGIGQIFRIQGDFNRALENYLNALAISEQLNNQLEVSRIGTLIGWLYINEGNDSLSIEFGQRSLDQALQLNDKATISGSYNLLGYVHLQRKDFHKATSFFSKALELREDLKLHNEVCSTIFNLARVYRDQGLYEKSIEYCQRILQYDVPQVDRRLLVMVYNSLGDIYLIKKDAKQAFKYLAEAKELAMKLNLPIQLKDNTRLFAAFYKQQHDFRRASEYYEEYIALNDSLFKQETLDKVAQLSAVYQLSRKENEIRSLSKENEARQSQIEVQDARLKLQKNILIFSIVGLALLSLLLYVLYMYYRAKKKSHEELSLLHHKVSEKNEKIQAQSEELMKVNEDLIKLNNQLIESREEVQAQSEELIEANETISSINTDLERKVSERTAQLEKAYTELDTFFYRSSHDFRRPLTTFLGLAEVAKITVKDKNSLELFEKVKDTALNLDKMLVKLQSISDVSAQRLYYEEVDLKSLILDSIGGFRTVLEEKGIATDFRFEAERKLYTYPVLVKIIVENLVENSINFCTQDLPFIAISTIEDENSVSLEIKDNGQGFASEFSDKIFDMYFRANFMSKGNGLGLYIVKKAVDKLNGTLNFSSVLYQGSMFTVTIPIRPDIPVGR